MNPATTNAGAHGPEAAPNQDVKKRFGLVLKQRRRQAGFSQEELAARAELHRTYISDIERGARNPSLETLARLAQALQVPLSSLFQSLENFQGNEIKK